MKTKIILFISAILLTGCNSSNSDNIHNDYFDKDIFPFSTGDQNYGYFDKTGKIVINPQFEFAFLFYDGIARVSVKNKGFGFIDKSGKFVIEPKFIDATDFSEGLSAVVLPYGKCQFIDKSGKVIISLNKDIMVAHSFHNGMAMVINYNNEKSYINKKGEFIINKQINPNLDFSEGLARFSKYDSISKKMSFGFINTKGEIVIQNLNFNFVSSFSEDLAIFSIDNKYGFIDKKGAIVINPQFNSARVFKNGLASVRIEQGNNVFKWGYIDKKGKFIIEAQFDDASYFSENGFAKVGVKNDETILYGFINRTGKYEINPQYTESISFIGDIALARTSKTNYDFGIINQKGLFIANPQFRRGLIDNMINFKYGYFLEGSFSAGVSDFIDFNAIKKIVTQNCKKPDTFFGFTKNSNFNQINSYHSSRKDEFSSYYNRYQASYKDNDKSIFKISSFEYQFVDCTNIENCPNQINSMKSHYLPCKN